MSQAAFDERVAAYAQSRSHREGPTLDLTLELANARPGNLVLDVSTGTGFTAHALAATPTRVVAADIAPSMLRHTRATAPKALRVVQTDTHRLAFADRTFDVVTCRHAFHHYGDGPAAMAEMSSRGSAGRSGSDYRHDLARRRGGCRGHARDRVAT